MACAQIGIGVRQVNVFYAVGVGNRVEDIQSAGFRRQSVGVDKHDYTSVGRVILHCVKQVAKRRIGTLQVLFRPVAVDGLTLRYVVVAKPEVVGPAVEEDGVDVFHQPFVYRSQEASNEGTMRFVRATPALRRVANGRAAVSAVLHQVCSTCVTSVAPLTPKSSPTVYQGK